MTGRLTLVTLGVRDLERSGAFYTAVGFERASSPDGLVLLRTVGSVIALYGWDDLAADAGEAPAAQGFRGVALAWNHDTVAEVDAALARFVDAGGRITRAAERAEWGGYSGYVADPDGHLWEHAHNPFLRLDDEGRLVAHD